MPVIVVSSETEFEQFAKGEVCDNNNYFLIFKHIIETRCAIMSMK